ncbi:hypothetical protein [Spirulina subsalsa]|uniref:hypothetical protein n=1 Tax=Spirulina subsalsa TaxID=54311 RepID=UPI0002EB16A3|nr:hypothetical protein [Spirulina subsalsa]
MKYCARIRFWPVICSLGAIAPLFLFNPAAQAQTGMSGNYMGFGMGNNSSGLVEDLIRQQFGGITIDTLSTLTGINLSTPPKSSASSSPVGTSFNGRYDVPHSNLSVRGAAFLGSQTRVVEPSVSYDFPVAENTNVYVGGGYTFVEGKSTATPLGETSSPVITAGVETAVMGDFVIYGNARFRLSNPTPNSSPLRMQVGAGYRF